MPDFDPYAASHYVERARHVEREARAYARHQAGLAAQQRAGLGIGLDGRGLAHSRRPSCSPTDDKFSYKTINHPHYSLVWVHPDSWNEHKSEWMGQGWKGVGRSETKALVIIGRGDLSHYSSDIFHEKHEPVKGKMGEPMPENKTIREQLQDDTDKWLNETKAKIRRK